MQTIKSGDKVVILNSEHPDVNPGALGVVSNVFSNGYGVTIKGRFGLKGEEDERTIFFKEEFVRLQT